MEKYFVGVAATASSIACIIWLITNSHLGSKTFFIGCGCVFIILMSAFHNVGNSTQKFYDTLDSIAPRFGNIFDYESTTPRSALVDGVKPGGKWIVVTSVSSPTEDVKRLASLQDWNLVVVADTKTPLNWTLDGVHFLSVARQMTLPFQTVSSLPFKSYTRKNIGYLYAISKGAEWIYDTDDDNKPYDKLGLEQFDYEDEVSGIRYRAPDTIEDIRHRLFNPYRYFGMKQMWPRGFPLEHFEAHTNGNESQVVCRNMKRAAVQQGLVHHDPDVDAIYRLLNADQNSGLDVKFNKFTPPITLSVGTYSPWNSQNTLFHKSAFHTLFLPTTVSFRTTDIWRSFISQKVLHLSGLTVSFVPTNAVQYRNAHNYLKDFQDETQVYGDSGKMIEYLHNWKCDRENVKECMGKLAKDLVVEKLWREEDARRIGLFLEDLESLNFEFPSLLGGRDVDLYAPSTNETTREVNCRRMNLEFDLVDPKEESLDARRAVDKLNHFGDIAEWCNATGFPDLIRDFPSPDKLAREHNENYVLENEKSTALVVVNNYPWKYGIGLLQRLYQPYFATVIFCGSYYPDQIDNEDNHTSTISPFNYVHINPAEIHRGYFAYHCITLVKELRLSNIQGYFLMADDAFFNLWQRIDYKRTFHISGVTYNDSQFWWNDNSVGLPMARNIVKAMNETKDAKVKKTWKQFEDGLRKYGYIKNHETAEKDMTSGLGRSISDFYYIPSSQIEYYGSLMRIFYDHNLFLELAVNRFLRSVNHQTSLAGNSSYLWFNQEKYAELYNENMVAMHPVKVSMFRNPGENRKKYCECFMQTWADIIFKGSRNFTVRGDADPDYLNG